MSLSRSFRVDRRRRVLVDESRNEQLAGKPRIFRGDADGPLSRYNAAALQAMNAPIAGYLPLRPYWLLVWFLGGLVPILGLLLLDVYRLTIAQRIGSGAAGPFDLGSPGSLLGWFSAILFAVMCVVVLGIYSVRRHRRDDYRGRFTVWRWAMIVALLASADASTGMHRAWQGLCEHASGTSHGAGSELWWLAPWAVLFGGTIIRLLFEMSSSRNAVGWASAAVVCYGWSLVVALGWAPVSNRPAQLSQAAAILVAHHFMLLSLLSYARHVVLEAMGQIAAPVRRSVRLAKTTPSAALQDNKAKRGSGGSDNQADEAKPSLTAVSPAADGGPTAKQARSSKQEKLKLRAVHAPDTDESSTEADAESGKLSKSERRRLRKEQKRRKAA